MEFKTQSYINFNNFPKIFEKTSKKLTLQASPLGET